MGATEQLAENASTVTIVHPTRADAYPKVTVPHPVYFWLTEHGRIRVGKQVTLIAMLRAPDGATIQEIMVATGWQSHTVRGAMSGALKKKLGLKVTSEKVEDRGRVYKPPPPDASDPYRLMAAVPPGRRFIIPGKGRNRREEPEINT